MPTRVFVTDDDARDRDLVAASLESEGYEVCRILRQGPRTRQIPEES